MSNRLKLSMSIALLFGFVVLILVITSNSLGSAKRTPNTPTSSDPAIQRLSAEIKEYEEILANSTLSPADRSNIEAKLSLAKSELESRVAALTSSIDVIALKSTKIAEATQIPATPRNTDARPTGILEDPQSIWGYRDATFTTVWIAPYEGTYIKVYAGRLVSDPNQGILVVVLENSNAIETYLSPLREGELRIISIDRGRLAITTEKGTDLYFDPEARIYYDKDGNPWTINSLTPTPQSPAP